MKLFFALLHADNLGETGNNAASMYAFAVNSFCATNQFLSHPKHKKPARTILQMVLPLSTSAWARFRLPIHRSSGEELDDTF
jgi:hypothetical protein